MAKTFENLLDQISNWHENDDHDNIINAVLEIPEAERGYELTCLLARAYNNRDDYEKALKFLISVEEEGKYDLMWHFRIGYAYYYLDMLEKAEKAFERVLESDSGNEDALDFLDWIREEIKEADEIKPEQEKAAMTEMIVWLSHENELGVPPSEIESAGEFDLHGFHYYIYKYKKSSSEPWLLGVAGGYGRCDLNHCGHVFSEMEEYFPKTAEKKAIALVEMIREAWMNEAEKEWKGDKNSKDEAENTPRTGPFGDVVLLNSNDFDAEQIKTHLKNDWGIPFEEGNTIEEDFLDNPTLVFESGGMLASVTFKGGPVPNGEAEHFAETNYMWTDAVSETKKHVAQIVVVVLDRGQPAIEAAKFCTKITSCCLKLENAVGVYTSGTVFQPMFFIDVADLMKEEKLPIQNWIYFGIYSSEGQTGGYTYGLRLFGKEEIEIIDSTAMPEFVHDFLTDIAYYILSEDIILKDGETIGFTESQKFKITKSKGNALGGYTFKINY